MRLLTGRSYRLRLGLEVISHVATTGGDISGLMIRDLMLESVERRFGEAHTPHSVEWLSDNGLLHAKKKP